MCYIHRSMSADAPSNRSLPSRRSRLVLTALVLISTLALDLWSKNWAWENLRRQRPMKIIEPHLEFAFSFNLGAAFGFLNDASWSRVFFIVVTVIALNVPGIFGGAIITEVIFKVNGIGQLLITWLFARLWEAGLPSLLFRWPLWTLGEREDPFLLILFPKKLRPLKPSPFLVLVIVLQWLWFTHPALLPVLAVYLIIALALEILRLRQDMDSIQERLSELGPISEADSMSESEQASGTESSTKSSSRNELET